MEQCPFCREPDRFVHLLDDMQKAILKAQNEIKRMQSEIGAMSRVDRHMHYLTRELADFKTDRKTFLTAVKAMVHFTKKTGIIP